MGLRAAIVDLDGTVYRGDTLLPGVPEAVHRLREAGLELLFFSNNPTKPGSAYVDRLSEFGLSIRPGEACSAGDVTTGYLREHHAGDEIMLVGSSGLREQLRGADLALTDDPAETDVLLGSWTPEFDYGDMTAALRAVDAATAFLGTDPDRTVPGADGRLMPGSGAVVESLAATVGRDPDAVLGKPSAVAREAALDRLGVPPEDCLIVGDRLDTDVEMGARAGMTTVLVLSGVSDRSDLAGSDADPEYVLDGLGDVGTVLADQDGFSR